MIGTCDYCSSEDRVLRPSPYMADRAALMCIQCWEFSRQRGIALEETDIGPFDEVSMEDIQ